MKVLNALGNAAILVAIVLLIGTAGASDNDTYTTIECIRMAGLCTVLLLSGIVAKGYAHR